MMLDENGWHPAQAQLADYAGGRATFAQAASVEIHLTACADCRWRLSDVLPELPVERMWERILSATDPAPSRRHRQVAGRMRMWSWTALFRASAFGPRRVGIATLTVLLGLTLLVPLAYPYDRTETAGTTVGPPQPAVEFPALPKTSQKRGATIRPDPTLPAVQQLSAPPPAVSRERDRIPWRSGRHPD